MNRKRLALATVALVGLWAATPAGAQIASQYSQSKRASSYQHQQRSKTLADRLDEFGRALFGTGHAGQSGRSTRGSGATAARRDQAIELSPPASPTRAVRAPAVRSIQDATATGAAEKAEQPASPDASQGTALPDRDEMPWQRRAGQSRSETSPKASASGFGPLHERLKAFRESAFGQGPAAASGSEAAGASGTRSPETSRGGLENPASVYPKKPEAAALQRAVADRLAAQRAFRQTTPKTDSPKSKVASPAGPGAKPPAVGVKPPESVAERAADSVASGDADVLFLRQSPILSVETHGPRRITVGKQSTYEVIIHNSGQVAANELVVTVELPEWADVLGAEASAGATRSLDSADQSGEFLWKVGRLDAKSQEKLSLRIIPRQSRPFELGVKWSFTPVRSQAEIEVQEPKLVLELEGPREVLHGRKEVYKLKVSNTGNGPAENLLVKLTPTGPGENVSASHKLATLAAGQKKVIEVELAARHAGQLTIQVRVDGDGGVHAELTEKILVRRAALSITVKGPKLQYVGTAATYEIRLANTGNAPARNVAVAAKIPQGAEQVSATQGGSISPDGKNINWNLAELAPEAERTLLVKCELGQAGAGRLAVDASADDNLVASGAAATQVEAIADLVLSVVDPAGPVPVGQKTTYQVRIQNRGSKSAEKVEAVGYFSQGIEPTSAEGAAHKIAPGQVTFGPIPSIAAGQTRLLTIEAKATTAGNHVFRTEVYCRSLGARLVSEETTRFYGSGPASPETRVAQPSPFKAVPGDLAPKTAERRLRIEPIRSSQRPLPEAEKKR